jgi:hypothetical protein
MERYYHHQPYPRVHFSTDDEPTGMAHPISTSIEFVIVSATVTAAAEEALEGPGFEEVCFYAPPEQPHLAHCFAVDRFMLAAAASPSVQRMRLVQVKFSALTLAIVLQNTSMVLVEDCLLSDGEGVTIINLETA